MKDFLYNWNNYGNKLRYKTKKDLMVKIGDLTLP